MGLTEAEIAMRVLAGMPVCPTCGRPMAIGSEHDRVDVRFWLCAKHARDTGAHWCERAEALDERNRADRAARADTGSDEIWLYADETMRTANGQQTTVAESAKTGTDSTRTADVEKC